MKQFSIPFSYRSPLIGPIKEARKQADRMKKDLRPTLLDFGSIHIYLARHFGFCYGVENAIDIAFRTIEENPGKHVFLLSEMIHNPRVNADLEARGVRFLQDTQGRTLIPFDNLTQDDIVLIPAFGTTLEIEAMLHQKGIQTEAYDTTCPFVEKVWNRSAQIAREGFTVVVHGKPTHEETRATFSHAAAKAPAVIVYNMDEARQLAKWIRKEAAPEDFFTAFAGRYTTGFDPEKDLQKLGVVNQTTMLASDTQAIADYLKQVMLQMYPGINSGQTAHFADTRDTLCYATNDNQSAVQALLEIPAQLALVVGGYKSSNTSHLVELCEEKLPTYYIDNPDCLITKEEIQYGNWRTGEILKKNHYWPLETPVSVLITSGASCPDAMVEEVILRLTTLHGADPAAYTVRYPDEYLIPSV